MFSQHDGDQGIVYIFAARFVISIASWTVVGSLLASPARTDTTVTDATPRALESVDAIHIGSPLRSRRLEMLSSELIEEFNEAVRPAGQPEPARRNTALLRRTAGLHPSSTASRRVLSHEDEPDHAAQWRNTVIAYMKMFWSIPKAIVMSLINPPTISIGIGLVIACTPVLRHVLYGPDEDPTEGQDKAQGQLAFLSKALECVSFQKRMSTFFAQPSCYLHIHISINRSTLQDP